MTLRKVTQIGLIEVTPAGVVQVRTDTLVLEGDEVIGEPTHHRHAVRPGEDYAGENERVRAVCEALHTADVVAAYQAAIASAQAAADAELEQPENPPESDPIEP